MRDEAAAPTYVIAFAVAALALAAGTVARAAVDVGPEWHDPGPVPEPSAALRGMLGLDDPADEGLEDNNDGSGAALAALTGAPTEDPTDDGSGEALDDGSGADLGDGSGAALDEGSGADAEPPIPGLVPFPTEEEQVEARANMPSIVDDEPNVRRLEVARRHEDAPCRVSANRALIVREIHRREPVETTGPYYADGYPTIVYLDTQNTTGRRQRLTVQWLHTATGTVYRNRLNAGPSHRWRTWAERALPLSELGEWTVEVLDDDRCLVTSRTFTLQAPSW